MAEPEYSGIVYTLDDYKAGAIGVAAPEANGPAYVERTFINFDMVEGVHHRDYKVIQRIDPVVTMSGPTPIQVSCGWRDSAGGDVFAYGAKLDHDGTVATRQRDFRSSGRYHALRIDYADIYPVKINALEIDFTVQGTRG